MKDIDYSVKDPWRAPRLGAHGKKIVVAFKTLFCGYIAFLFFAYAAHLIAGTSLASTWWIYRFFPVEPSPIHGLIPTLLWNIGIVAAILITMVGATGIVKITYRQLKGDDFYGSSDAWKFALEHGRSTISTPLILALMFGIICLLLWIFGLVSRIPSVGPIALGLLLIPAFITALLGIYLVIALSLSLLYTPAVIGTTCEDGLEGVVQVFSLLWSFPWRTTGYTAVAAMTTTAGTYLLAVISQGALALLCTIFGTVYGPSFSNIVAGVRAYLPLDRCLSTLPSLLWPGPFALLFPAGDSDLIMTGSLSGIESVTAFLGGLSLLIVSGLILAYGLSSFASGITASYLTLRKMKDGEIVLEWTDEVDELEEQIPDAGEPVGRSDEPVESGGN